MTYNFIYTKEYQRPLRAVLVDIRYEQPYPTVDDNDLFYKIEADNGSLAGVLILSVNNELRSCVNKFQAIRIPFISDTEAINNSINALINSNDWQNDYLFH